MRSALQRMLRPRSVAIIGASPTPTSLGRSVLTNLERFDYPGEIHLVNPKRAEIAGRPCVASVEALPEGVDCAILAIPRTGVLAAIEACGKRDVGGVVVFSAGFAEVDEEGRALQMEMARLARAAGMALNGPNCLGTINYVDQAPLSFSLAYPQPWAVAAPAIAIVSQSGAMATVLRAALVARELPVSFAVSTGNEAVNGVEDFLEAVLDDPITGGVVMVVEQFADPPKFLALARRAREAGKPVVLLHPGRSAAARASAASHTGKLAGDHALMRCQVEAEGVLLAETLDELIDCAEIITRCKTRPRGGCAVLTDSGVFKAQTLDLAEQTGLSLPRLAPQTLTALGEVMPSFAPLDNPLDMTAQGLVQPELYGLAMERLFRDPAVGSLLLTMILSSEQMASYKLPLIIGMIRDIAPTKPLVVATMGDDLHLPEALISELHGLDIPCLRSPERALRALARLGADATPPPRSTLPPQPLAGLRPGTMAEYAGKQVLEAAGLAFPPRELALDLASAIKAADRVGYPVALKAQSAALPHKTEAGAVLLRIADAEALTEAWHRLHENVGRHSPGLQLDGVLVEAMAKPGIELIIGARRDPLWGPILLAGLGGVMAEALQDVRLMPADLAPEAIMAELLKLKGARLLTGFRGAPPADLRAAADLLTRLGAVMRGNEQIEEIDLNPVMLYPRGEGLLPLDALVVCRAA